MFNLNANGVSAHAVGVEVKRSKYGRRQQPPENRLAENRDTRTIDLSR